MSNRKEKKFTISSLDTNENKSKKPRSQSNFKILHKSQLQSPGPGSYQLRSQFKKDNGFTISLKPKQYHRQKRPDVWSYMPDHDKIKIKSPKAQFGKYKLIQRLITVPAPNQYNINYKQILKSIERPTIGTQERLSPNQSTTPAPGHYFTEKVDSLLRHNRSATIGSSPRKIFEDNKVKNPGPNNYLIKTKFDQNIEKKKGFSLKSRLKYKTQSEAPQNFLKYNNTKNNILRKAPAYSLKKQQRLFKLENNSPGPTSYESNLIKKFSGVTIPKSGRNDNIQYKSPSPNTYNIQKYEKGQAFSIPKSKQKLYQKEKRPSPNTYKIQQSTNKYSKISFGFGNKHQNWNKQKIPPPGTYNLNITSLNKGPLINPEAKFFVQRDEYPGPAHYDVKQHILSRSVSIQSQLYKN